MHLYVVGGTSSILIRCQFLSRFWSYQLIVNIIHQNINQLIANIIDEQTFCLMTDWLFVTPSSFQLYVKQ